MAAGRAAMQRPRKGSKLALDGRGPANELVVELVISITECHYGQRSREPELLGGSPIGFEGRHRGYRQLTNLGGHVV